MKFLDESRYRWGVAARTVAAIGGGYLLTAVAMAVLALLLPLPRADAAVIGTMLSFAVYACAAMWAFASRSALRVLIGMLAGCGLLAALLWLAGGLQ